MKKKVFVVEPWSSKFNAMRHQVKLKTEIHKKVVNLELRNLDLQYRKQSRIKGTIRLDDYREFDKGLFSEKLDYAYVDLEELSLLKLPVSSSTRYIESIASSETFKVLSST